MCSDDHRTGAVAEITRGCPLPARRGDRGQGPAQVVAPCCRRVGGSDDNTELSRVSTAVPAALHARITGWSGLQNGRDALPARRADRDQSAHRLAGLLLLLGELLG